MNKLRDLQAQWNRERQTYRGSPILIRTTYVLVEDGRLWTDPQYIPDCTHNWGYGSQQSTQHSHHTAQTDKGPHSAGCGKPCSTDTRRWWYTRAGMQRTGRRNTQGCIGMLRHGCRRNRRASDTPRSDRKATGCTGQRAGAVRAVLFICKYIRFSYQTKCVYVFGRG